MCACFSDETWFRILLPNSSSIPNPKQPHVLGWNDPSKLCMKKGLSQCCHTSARRVAKVCNQCCDDMRHNWDMLCTWLCLQRVLWHCYMTHQDSAQALLHLMEALTTSGPVQPVRSENESRRVQGPLIFWWVGENPQLYWAIDSTT